MPDVTEARNDLAALRGDLPTLEDLANQHAAAAAKAREKAKAGEVTVDDLAKAQGAAKAAKSMVDDHRTLIAEAEAELAALEAEEHRQEKITALKEATARLADARDAYGKALNGLLAAVVNARTELASTRAAWIEARQTWRGAASALDITPSPGGHMQFSQALTQLGVDPELVYAKPDRRTQDILAGRDRDAQFPIKPEHRDVFTFVPPVILGDPPKPTADRILEAAKRQLDEYAKAPGS